MRRVRRLRRLDQRGARAARRRRDAQEPFGLPPGVREDHTLDDLVAAARFPVYAAGPDGRVDGVGFDRERVTAVTVAAEGVTVTSSLPGAGPEVHGPEVAARLRLAELLDEQPEVGGLSEDAAQLVRRDAHRRAREAAEAAPVAPVPLTVDGAPVEFLLIAAGDRWAACAALPGMAIEVTARGVRPEDVALTRR